MRQRGTVEADAPARTDPPPRQIVVSLCFTYAMALAIALSLPHAGIAPLISIAVPVTAVALAVAFTVPPGGRGEIWAGVGFKPRRRRGLLTAVIGPAVFIAVSFSIAAAFGVVRFPGLAPDFGGAVLNLTITTLIFTVVFLGASVGGATCFRLAELTSGRRAALLTGAFPAISIYLCCCSPRLIRARATAG